MKKNILLLIIPFLLFSKELTLEEKIGQLLMVHFNGEEINQDARKLISEAHVGAFIYFAWANGLHNPEQVRRLSLGLQSLSNIPLIIAVDQEGGRITRLKNGFSQPPPNSFLEHPTKVEVWAETVAKELRAVGINMNLAPVVDVNSNPNNPVIGDRSYSNEPWEVARLGAAALKGYLSMGITPVLKHFPGHGDTTTDSHATLPVINKTRTQLDDLELLPFKRLLNQAPAIMIAHLLVPSLDPDYPTSLSKKVITNLLREELGFQGVIISDSLVMQGLLSFCPNIEEAAIQAIAAGTDIIILGGKQLAQKGFELTPDQIISIHHALVNAVKTGRLSQENINQSVNRILKLKKLDL